jgi:hypothetical protein
MENLRQRTSRQVENAQKFAVEVRRRGGAGGPAAPQGHTDSRRPAADTLRSPQAAARPAAATGPPRSTPPTSPSPPTLRPPADH